MRTINNKTSTVPESYLDLEQSMAALLRASIAMRVVLTCFQLAE